MALRVIEAPFALLQAGVVRSSASSPEETLAAVAELGRELGRTIVEDLQVVDGSVRDRNGHRFAAPTRTPGHSVVVTTRNDQLTLGNSLGQVIQPSSQGWMDFGPVRGPAVLDAPIREIELPAIGRRPVRALVVGKAVLATGCTAATLTRAAVHEYQPERLIIASIFYSIAGVDDLQECFPNADIYVVGEPSPLAEDGTLDIGYIAELM